MKLVAHLTRSGIEPTSPVLANGFFITEPPSEVKVTQSCSTLCDPMDYTVHGILQARILDWIAAPFSRGSSQLRDRTQVSRPAGGFLTSYYLSTNSIMSLASSFLLSLALLTIQPVSFLGARLPWRVEQREHRNQTLYFYMKSSMQPSSSWIMSRYNKSQNLKI